MEKLRRRAYLQCKSNFFKMRYINCFQLKKKFFLIQWQKPFILCGLKQNLSKLKNKEKRQLWISIFKTGKT